MQVKEEKQTKKESKEQKTEKYGTSNQRKMKENRKRNGRVYRSK